MKKALVLGLVALLVMGFGATAYAKAQKVFLQKVTGGTSCSWTLDEVVGFVIFNNPDPAEEGSQLTVVISLKKGDPTTTYKVGFCIVLPGSGTTAPESPSPSGWTLTTNHRGHGNLELNLYGVAFPPGLCQVSIPLMVDGLEAAKFATEPVKIVLKQAPLP